MITLRIGVDARELLGNPTGVGLYLGELLRRWTARPDAHRRQFVLYSPGPLSMPFPASTVVTEVISGGRGTWWEQLSLGPRVRRDELNVFFAPAYTAPLGLRVPHAVTIHDVSFFAHPEWFRPREGFRRRLLTRRVARTAAAVFTDSDFSRREIAHHLRVELSRLHVIPPGVTPRSAGRAGVRDPLVLYVGSIFNRRRLPDLIAAFAMAAASLPSARLAIVGDDRTWPPQDLCTVADAHGIRSRVDFHRYITDEGLAALYARASVFAFLSEYEGFGLTPLEALSAGVPPLVLDTPVAREVYGDAAIFVQRGDIHGTAAALRRLLTDPPSAGPVLMAASRVLARYSWTGAANRILEHLERIARQ